MYEPDMTQQTPRRFTIDKAVFFPALILLFGAIVMVLTLPEKGSNPFGRPSGSDRRHRKLVLCLDRDR